MTNIEFKKEAKSSGFAIIQRGWLIVTIVSFFITTGIGIGVSQTQLSQKVDKLAAQEIAKVEVKSELRHFFSDVDGKILQTKLDYLIMQIEELNKRLDRMEKYR